MARRRRLSRRAVSARPPQAASQRLDFGYADFLRSAISAGEIRASRFSPNVGGGRGAVHTSFTAVVNNPTGSERISWRFPIRCAVGDNVAKGESRESLE